MLALSWKVEMSEFEIGLVTSSCVIGRVRGTSRYRLLLETLPQRVGEELQVPRTTSLRRLFCDASLTKLNG